MTLKGLTKRITLLIALAALPSTASAEWKEKVLYSFQGGSDGFQPAGGVVFDKSGNLYGATSWGGTICPSPGCGVVFEVSRPSTKGGAWTETAIYMFKGVQGGLGDGLTPVGGVIIDQQGDLYGTTSLGGSGPCILLGSPAGCGTVYKLSPPAKKGMPWKETILYNFQGGTDGYFPWGDLVFDTDGNLYGATQFGGGKGTTCNQFYGGNCGTVFELIAPAKGGGKWREKVLHNFAGGAKGDKLGDGANPNGGVVFDGKGAIYGTTYFGGNESGRCDGGSGGTGCGAVFELIPPSKNNPLWKEKLLHLFQGFPDGSNPAAGVIFGSDGALYGTTKWGGREGTGGTVFEVKPSSANPPSWTEAVLYRFKDENDGANPTADIVLGSDGYLYSTATIGGEGESVGGDVFRLKPSAQKGWSLGVLHGFTGTPDGSFPAGGLIFDKQGNLYSTTQQGGTGAGCSGGCGTVFRVGP